METGKLADQANGAVKIQYGETVALVTATISSEQREGVDFLPLTIDYEERLYAAGKIPGGFIRREGRPTQEAVLAGRLADRSIRPLLPHEWRREIQVIITILSVDQENDADTLGIIGGSAALTISEMPFDGPLGACRVGYMDCKYVLNPTLTELDKSQLDMVIASSRDKVVMIEVFAREASEDIVYGGIEFGHKANQQLIDLQATMRTKIGLPKYEVPPVNINQDCVSAVDSLAGDKMTTALDSPDKATREIALAEIKNTCFVSLGEKYSKEDMLFALDKKIKKELRENILVKHHRVSGRAIKQIRNITCEVGILPRTHGSALFTRGQTQILDVTTLGSIKDEQRLEGLGIEDSKRFMHHYNMPPYATGEAKRLGTTGRREIGHGALVERALLAVLPSEADFPYAIRCVSEAISSSGSTSMASCCAASLSLMDAGVPIKKPIAGISIGLVSDDNGAYQLLTDIEGIEDNYGDMDFKVAGTDLGICAIQMDTKLKGLTLEICRGAIMQAKEARSVILDIMNKCLSKPRAELSKYAPRMYKIKINPDKIGTVIGSGGKTVRSISEDTKSTIDIEDDGTVIIGSQNEANAKRAIQIIEGLTRDILVGDVFTGKVSRILNFGAMVEILPGKEGMVHVSELADYRVGKVEDVVKIGDAITVQVIEIDNLGRVNLSRRALLDKAAGKTGEGGAPREGQGERRPVSERPRGPGGPSGNRFGGPPHPPMGRPQGGGRP
jgi:polyribonucleotide nucleotidyltransferase